MEQTAFSLAFDIPDAPKKCTISKAECFRALVGLKLAFQERCNELIELQDSLLEAKVQRKRHIDFLRRKKLMSKKKKTHYLQVSRRHYAKGKHGLQEKIDDVIPVVEFFRGQLTQQIADTQEFGFTDLAERYAKKVIDIESPFIIEPVPKAERAPLTEKQRAIARAWREVRIKLKKILDAGGAVLPTFDKGMKDLGDLIKPHTKILPAIA
ncbi:hypothetical protein CL635_02265 [bacterium]|jgi:hypothetical protein|nr:hypothetical protein [bacterium]|tara:strand:- start:1728 stop:2357 length:630 start_codon:yes stop_codon:yes gene_type:complete